MRIGQRTMALLVVGILLGTIGIASATGLYQTKGGNGNGKGGGPSLPSAGQSVPQDIRGSMTFGQIAAGFGIPLADLAEAFRLPGGASAADLQLKDLKALGLPSSDEREVGVASVRWFVALYLGLPYAPAGEEGLLPEALAVLEESAESPLDAETRRRIEDRLVLGG